MGYEVAWGMRRAEPLRYLDQFVDIYDPELGLALPEQVAAMVMLTEGHPSIDPGVRWLRLLAALLRDRGAPRLRTLLLVDWCDHALDPWDICFETGEAGPLLRRHAGRLAALSGLHIGRYPASHEEGYCHGVGAALTTLPALQRLHLVGARGWDLLPPAGHPRLRELLVAVPDQDDEEALEVLLTAPFPALEQIDLHCWPELAEALAEGSFAAALGRRQWPALQRLTLRALSEPELAGLAGSELPGGLHTLVLADAPTLGDAALGCLEEAPWLAGLRRLELLGTAVSPALATRLGARGPVVITS